MNIDQLLKELTFKAVRSSGPGGQHVNKVSSKVSAFLNISTSKAFSLEEKELLLKNLSGKVSNEDLLSLHCDESRSQHKNKELVIKKMIVLIEKSLVIPKKRKPTKPTKASVQKRLDNKKNTARKKSFRKKIDD